MNNRTVKNIIPACGADFIMPFILVYMFYIIFHGHLSPGGGFQGGVLMVASVLLVYMGHGYKTASRAFNLSFNRKAEGVAVIVYILLAFLGVVFGASFCLNYSYTNGNIGDLLSSGTISSMDEAVGFNVLTGVSVLALSMLGLVISDIDKE